MSFLDRLKARDERIKELEGRITKALKVLEQCQDSDECCLFTDDGVCYDDDCIIAEAKTILSKPSNNNNESVSKIEV